MKRHCLECEEKIYGRSDKKFCSDQCRSSYNNRLNSDSTNIMRNINNLLRKNRRILAELNPNGKAKVHRKQLEEKGFRFNYFTNEFTTRTGNTYRFCYDQGYLVLNEGLVALVIRKTYVT